MSRFVLVVGFVLVAPLFAFAETQSEYEQQDAAFKRWWGETLVWKFDDLPLEGNVPDERIPYSGHDYPDRGGGTIRALNKYDYAFRTGGRASSWERWDTTAYQEPVDSPRRGLFGRVFARSRMGTPHWHGHCNGWTAAAMRHAEPVNSVVRNGVTFTPADIKGLLAEVYMYQDIEYLGGAGYAIDPATFHVVITNWLGRGGHPIAMDSTLGKEVWNYPIYSYKATANRYSPNAVEVSMNFVYRQSTKREFDKGPDLARQWYMHYRLDLNNKGEITGGAFYNDSNRMDILWAPLAPVQAGKPGNERGNPHVNVEEVLAIWRASVPEETRKQWLNINPTKEDAVEIQESLAKLLPSQEQPVAESTETETETEAEESADTAAAETAVAADRTAN